MEVLSSSETSVLTRAHGVTSQKTPFFIVTTVKTSNLTYWWVDSKVKWGMLCRKIFVTYQQYWQLISIYFTYFHSLMKNRIISKVNWSDSKKVFTLQKKIVRIMVGIKPQNSCRDLFKRIQILPLPYDYIFSWLNFIISNQGHFQANSVVHSFNTRNKHHLHRPIANLTGFRKRTYYSGINIFNNLQSSLKSLMNEKAKFK
jgi:hypothetical protein